MAEEKQETNKNEEEPLNNVKHKLYKKVTFYEKLSYIKDNITVEPLMAGFCISVVISSFAVSNLNLDKACRVNLGLGDDVCKSLLIKDNKTTNVSVAEKKVQEIISSIEIWRGIIQTALPCVIIMFLGAWSDRTGKRKLLILLPISGALMTSISNLLNVYFFYEIPVHMTMLLETIFSIATGGGLTMSLGVFSYISDITSDETRTFRVSLVHFCTTVSAPVGISLGGILLKWLGYYSVFGLTTVMLTLVLLYGIFCLKEPNELLKNKGLPQKERDVSITNVSFFEIGHVVETVAVAFQKRATNQRVKVILTLLAVFILYGPVSGGDLYMFLRIRLNWDMVNLAFYSIYSCILHSFGSMISITVLSKYLRVDDSLLCLICITSKFVSTTWTAFISTDIEVYLVPIVDVLSFGMFTSLRSIISKLVEKQEIAKANSLISLTETFSSLCSNPFYSWLYLKTLNFLPGAVFLVSSAFTIPAWFILIWFYWQYKREVLEARKKNLDEQVMKEPETDKKDCYPSSFQEHSAVSQADPHK